MSDLVLPSIVRSVADLRAQVSVWRAAGLKVGFVPTMGALHDGHLSLVRLAKTRCDVVVASIFVNPKQFAPHEDLDRYPRDEDGDLAKLAVAGCDLVFGPNPAEMYPEHFSTSVHVAGVSAPLEGEMRPHFFGGVATVVTKLLLQCLPDVAVFGEKDFQQFLVIKKLVKDLDIPVHVIAGPTSREEDGLALSSRNAYLSADERRVAAQLNVIMHQAIEAARSGEALSTVEQRATQAMLDAGFNSVDYVAIRCASDLSEIKDGPIAGRARILVAARLGKTRLIDNMAV